MPTMAAMRWIQRRGPEATLAVLACVVFLGCLGSVDLWGKREQRASAEAIDTIDHDRWLVAQIQGRPRLEKPPLPRWTIATLMALTGRRDEWIVRLPGALAALAMVGLVTRLGSDMGGRSVGLASGLALTSMMFFTAELHRRATTARSPCSRRWPSSPRGDGCMASRPGSTTGPRAPGGGTWSSTSRWGWGS